MTNILFLVWKLGAEDWGELGMMVWDYCPHCEESQRTSGEEHAEGCFLVICMMIAFGVAAYLYEVVTK